MAATRESCDKTKEFKNIQNINLNSCNIITSNSFSEIQKKNIV